MNRLEYLLLVTYNYLKSIEDSDDSDILLNTTIYDNGKWDGHIIMDDIVSELFSRGAITDPANIPNNEDYIYDANINGYRKAD